MKRAAVPIVLALSAAVVSASGPAAGAELPDPPLSLSKFGLTRLRKTVGSSNVVTATFNIHTVRGADFRGLKAKVEYVDFEGKPVAKPNTSRLGDVAGGTTKPAHVTVGFVPQFNGYRITLTGSLNGRSGKWEFFGASGVDQPTYLPEKPIPKLALLMCVAHELRQPPRARWAKLYLRVRNLGAVSAHDATCAVEVRARRGKKAGTATSALKGAKDGRAGTVKGGEERLFVISFRSFPVYESYDVSLDWKSPPVEERLSGGEFEGKKEVELAHFSFAREGGDVVVKGDARNGLPHPVDNLRVIIRLYGDPKPASREPRVVGTATALVSGRTEPGKVRPFRAVGKGVKGYSDFEYEIAFEEGGGGPQPVAAGDAVVTIRKAVRKPDGTAEIEGDVRNAGAMGIAEVDIVFSFRKLAGGKQKVVRRVAHRIPGVLKPRATAAFKIAAKKVPAFDEYFYEVSYKPAGRK
ncbi:MAG: hypothetical protein ACYTKD_01085 [Planctomycetota bacterium]|jgi:hypothetical protein